MGEWWNTGVARTRPDQTDLPNARGGDRERVGIARSHTSAVVCSAGSVTGEIAAVHQGPFEPEPAGGVSGFAKTILGPAHVGARLLLCDGGSGRRSNDQGLYRDTAVQDGTGLCRGLLKSKDLESAATQISE
jgi:hypothetical protein